DHAEALPVARRFPSPQYLYASAGSEVRLLVIKAAGFLAFKKVIMGMRDTYTVGWKTPCTTIVQLNR
ncbi:MAG: hypothetical protein QMB24_13135, partial [Spirosomataceae bacterium]